MGLFRLVFLFVSIACLGWGGGFPAFGHQTLEFLMQGLDSLFVLAFGCKIFGFIRIGYDIVKLEGFGLKNPFHFAGSGCMGLGLFDPFRPGFGEEFSLGVEVSPNVFPFGMPGPDQFVGIGDNGFLPEWMNIGNENFIPVVFHLLLHPQAPKGLSVEEGVFPTGKIDQGRYDVAIHRQGSGYTG